MWLDQQSRLAALGIKPPRAAVVKSNGIEHLGKELTRLYQV